jgi:large subunit ribosomal protein L1
MKRSKKYQAAAKKIEAGKKYSADEAIKLLPELSISKFAGTAEVHIFLKLTEKQKKESVRGSYILPHSFGKETKVLLFADPSYKSDKSKADVVGGEELIKDVEAGKVDFDVVIAMPAMMPKIARLGKVLGTKGLMPNPKNGTVTADPDKTIAKFKSGLRNFKMSEDGRITAVIGKLDMKPEELKENMQEFFKQLTNEIKRLGVNVISKITISPTMGPAVNLDPSQL